ncbi:phage holin family protein [Streptomyces avicenniae]|uniref:phage holin family protein n=1 Tax=Streptomyces avicenniae TaxID=500153 RepID=UPI00069C4C09|nr:phage holin family protein [Streptomyces avicenniae]
MSRSSPPRDPSVGELVSDVTSDLETLLRQETALAKTEMREEAVKAGTAAGMFGGAGFAGYLVVVFGSLAGMFALNHVLAEVWSALIIAGAWALIGLVLLAVGRARVRRVAPVPKTVESLKEDAQWARHPTR